MKKLVLFILLSVIVNFSSIAQTDYLNDNVVYKTLYPNQLQEFLNNNPNALLIDVRSPVSIQIPAGMVALISGD
ncbi:MAG: hypothetical protein IPM91_00915 [Bacteroidetes bacterium]|nr:hypothetical protein [Bacteroidota bacterium]